MNYNEEVENILKEQRQYFYKDETKDIDFRLKQLKRLREAIKENENLIIDALYKDLHKPEFEAYATEIGFLLDSIKYIMKNLKSWAKAERVKTPLIHPGTKSYIYSEPYGVVLIIGPFNYPFQLLIEPLIGAISAGNCALLKPSEYTPNVSKVITDMINSTFQKKYIHVVEGEREITSALINSKFDHIFFTGSVRVGKIVMEAASKNLAPITLELGGKSPSIVDKDARLEIAAERIIWGKFLNAGQTCVAPDYLLVHRDIKKEFINKLGMKLRDFYGENPNKSQDYGRIVNEGHFNRLIDLIDKERVIIGGSHNKEDLFIEPTIMDNVTWGDRVMEEEIFGPILPIIEYDNLDNIITEINRRPKPLALYVFTENKEVEERVINRISFGGGCVNDTISHLSTPYLPFGGVGSSGIGSYHGKSSFDTFSHKKSIMKKSTRFSLKFIYPPYSKLNLKLLRRFLK